MLWIWILAGALLLIGAALFLGIWPQARRDRAAPGDVTVPLRAEQLQLTKTREQLAEVTAHKEIRRELKTVTVPVATEELVVAKDGVEAVRIPLSEERVEVSTRTVPLNDVSVSRQEWTDNKEIQAVLRKEVARIETSGDARYAERGPET